MEPQRTPSSSPLVMQRSKEEPIFQKVIESFVVNRLDVSNNSVHGEVKEVALRTSKTPLVQSLSADYVLPTLKTIETVTEDDVSDDEELDLEFLYRDVNAESARFLKAMESYESMAKKNGIKYNKPAGKQPQNWTELMEGLDTATAEYNDPSGTLGKIRRAFRKTSTKAGPVEVWSRLLPSQSEYFSLLSGGLGIILGAASRLRDLREEIEQAIIRIPDLLSCANREVNVWKGSAQLHSSCARLFVAVISLLQHILDYYTVKSSKKFIGAIFKQAEYERELTDKIRNLSDRTTDFFRLATTSSHEAIEDNRNETKGLRREHEFAYVRTNSHIELGRREQAAQHMDLAHRLARSEAMLNKVSATQERQEAMMNTVSQKYMDMFSSNPAIDRRTQDLLVPSASYGLRKIKSAPMLAKRNKAEDKCLSLLRYDEEMISSDIRRNLSAIHLLPRAAQDRAISIIRHKKLQAWISDLSSSALFVNANYSTMASTKHNPMSFVSAALVSSLKQGIKAWEEEDMSSLTMDVQTIVISFFASSHAGQKDERTGAVGMLQSLLAQLLFHYRRFRLETLQALQEKDLEYVPSLIEAFQALIDMLPPSVVLFCVVDGITLYEASEVRRPDVELFLELLADLVEAPAEEYCVRKVLIAGPKTSRSFFKKFREEDVVTISVNVPSSGGFTMGKWKAYSGL